jgi:hypothetical protein
VSAAGAAPPRPPSVWLSGYQAARTRFPPRPVAAGWPATLQAREQVAERLPGLLPGNVSGREALLDWLAGQDGSSWQQRWLASGTGAAAWWQLPRDWLRRSGHPVPAVAALASALVWAICADIVRPSLAWLVAGRRERPALARPRPAQPHRRDPRQPHRPHRRSRPRRLARRSRRTQDQPRRRRRQARPDRPAHPHPIPRRTRHTHPQPNPRNELNSTNHRSISRSFS